MLMISKFYANMLLLRINFHLEADKANTTRASNLHHAHTHFCYLQLTWLHFVMIVSALSISSYIESILAE